MINCHPQWHVAFVRCSLSTAQVKSAVITSQGFEQLRPRWDWDICVCINGYTYNGHLWCMSINTYTDIHIMGIYDVCTLIHTQMPLALRGLKARRSDHSVIVQTCVLTDLGTGLRVWHSGELGASVYWCITASMYYKYGYGWLSG